jgi:hypothetical protein
MTEYGKELLRRQLAGESLRFTLSRRSVEINENITLDWTNQCLNVKRLSGDK